MSFTEQDLETLANLARISISDEEKPKMLEDFQSILGYVSEINSVQGEVIRGEESVFNVVRDDVVSRETGSNTEALLDEAPATKDSYVKVEQVLK